MNHERQPIVELSVGFFHRFTIWQTLPVFIRSYKQVRTVVHDTEYNNTCYCNLGSFNRIKRSSLVWSYNTVETIKRHADDE